jgi:hypothetical protein
LRIGLSEEIVPVESLPKIVDLAPKVLADGIFGVGSTHVHVVVCALTLGIVLDKARGDDVEVVHDVGEGRRDIDIPIGSTVADNETLQVVALGLLVDVNKLVVLMNLPCKVGNIDSSIAFTRDIKRVVEELGVSSEEVLHGGKGVLGLSHIIVDSVLGVDTDGVADTGGALDVKDVSTFVPGLWVGLDVVFTIINNEGTVLLEEGKEGGAAGTTIEPDDDWVVIGVTQRSDKYVM